MDGWMDLFKSHATVPEGSKNEKMLACPAWCRT